MVERVSVGLDDPPLSGRGLTYVLEPIPEATITTMSVSNPVESIVDGEAGGLSVATDWYETAQTRADEPATTAYGIDRAVVGSVAGTVSRRVQLPGTIRT